LSDRESRLAIIRYWPRLRQPGVLRADFLAGLTGAVVVVPQGVAFATLAGMPPEYGLYTAIIPCIVAALLGSSRLMITGPANAISLTTMALVAPLAMPGSPDYVRLVLTLTFMVGAAQMILGLLRAGRLVDKVPHAVVVGFTVGAAVLIMNSQIAPLLGLEIQRGLKPLANLAAVSASWQSVDMHSILISFVTLAVLVLWRPFNKMIPGTLVAVVVASVAAVLLELLFESGTGVRRIAALPGGLPPLSSPDLSWETLHALLLPAATMTLLALTEATAIARAIALRSGDTLHSTQEFVGQGAANLAGAFFSCYPASGSFNRSGLNVLSGGQTPLSAMFAGLLLIGILAAIAPLAQHLPVPAIAALLLAVAWGLINVPEIRNIWREHPRQRLEMVVTMVATVSLSLEAAILLGLAVAFCVRLYDRRRARPADSHPQEQQH